MGGGCVLLTSPCSAPPGTTLARCELLHRSLSRKPRGADKVVSGWGGRRPSWQPGFHHLVPPLPVTSRYLGANAH